MNELYAKHLQGMVQIPTLSNGDPSKMDFAQFEKFHAYLAETYPLIHSKMEKTVIGRAGLLFRLKGCKSDKLPVLLMAHQDVVPEGDHSKWVHPPYSGDIADGCVWGRGSTDCKCVILAEMEAVEALLKEGFAPDYDLYLAFGYNEEVQSQVKNADEIVAYLANKGVRLGCVLDEGGDITDGHASGFDGFICNVGLGEKAYQDYEISMDCAGGHSMEPGRGTALGAVAKAAVAIEANPFPYRLTDVVENQLKALSRCMTGEKAAVYANPKANFESLCALAENDKALDALLRTTCAVTMAVGSKQPNILPEHAAMTMNCRVLQGDTEEMMMEHFRSIIPENVSIRKIAGDAPSPASPVDGAPYKLLCEVLKSLYGENTLVVPCLLAGGTDSRYFSPLSDNVFRFAGFLKDKHWGPAHQVNERIPCDTLETGVKFYRELLLRY